MKARPHQPWSGILQVVVITGLLAATLVLALAAISRHAVGEPILPTRISGALHRSESPLPRGMTYEFEVVDLNTRVPLATLPPNGAVQLRLAVTNDSALPMRLDFPTSMQCEFVARQVHFYLGGLFVLPLEVWSSSYFRNTSRKASRLMLSPGQTQVYDAVWQLQDIDGSPLASGDYRVLALFHGVTFRLQVLKPI